MDANDYATACPKLEEAVKLVPEGIGAKLTLAECYEGIGKLASAWSQYEIGKSLAERAGQKERAERAAARAEALRGRLATLTIEVPEAVQKIPGVTVARAGAALGREQWGMALPVDVGSYEITATAPGYKPWTRNVEVLKDGASASVRVDEIAPIECARPAEERKRPVAPVVVQRAAPETSWRRVLGLGVMGCVQAVDVELGTLSVMVAGGVFGGIASRNSALPRLAMTQVTLGVLPIGVGALLAHRSGAWLLVPPLVIYLAAMRTVVQRHYRVLVALIAARQRNAELVARFDAALTYMPHGLCMIDGDSRVIVANRRTAQLFGSPREIMLDAPLPDVVAALGANAVADSGAGLAAQCNAWLRRAEPEPFDIALADGRQLELTRHRVPDGNAVIIVEDVTARRQTEQHIRHLARHDALTGLPNRHELHAELTRRLARRPRLPGPAFAVMYLDLDGFKAINDRFGHQAGDEVLTQVAERLGKTLPPGELAARIGGDEFIVAIDDTTMQACSVLAARIIRQVSAPYALSIGETVCIGISIGIALDDGHGSPDELIRQADSALYDAKSAGKGIYCFYSSGSRRVVPAAAS